ncbi:MAG: hypothetical protein HXS54_18980 [Theionarchaea archaeon]|nr:hypothetical protein [Theionarchaea archaeon]
MEESSEVVLTIATALNFKTAKLINNDFIDIVRALSELSMRTPVGEEVKKRFLDAVEHELETLEESQIVF